jgi:tetratricopeptide (TPR) repeat protein
VTAVVVVALSALAASDGHPAPAPTHVPAGKAAGQHDALGAVREDLRAGRYERARRTADGLGGGRRGALAARAAVLAARAEEALGLLVEARRRLEEATVRAPDDLPLRAELIRVADAVGDRGAVKTLVDRSYEDWRGGKVDKSSAPDLVAMAVALRFDNNWDDANATLRSAVKVDPRFLEGNLEWGDIFLEKHSADNAEASFKEVLSRDPQDPDAHVGLARALLEQSYDEAATEKEIAAALAVNPRHARGLALRGEIALDAEELDQVAAVAAELRRTNPRDENAAWLAASRALLIEDRAGYEREKRARLAVRAADGEFFARTAEALVRHRRYQDAREVAAEGVALDGANAHCLGSLGLTLLRLGEERQGVETLRRAWDRDPYDARTFNLLDLFEKVIPARYVTVDSAHLSFRIEPKARAAVEAVVAPFLEEVYARYVARYGLSPSGRVVFELYGDPAHYAIRTVGLPRLGVTAVCFGRVITSQAPTNAAFNWGLVLAHELAHVFALQLSRSRVPRWFTEGLSELETTHLRPEWRRHGELALWSALAAGSLPPIAKLSQSFVRARDAEAASAAYLHAAVAVEYLEEKFGFPKIREALVAFGRGQSVTAVLEGLSGQPLAALERGFREQLATRSGSFRDQFLPAHEARASRRTERPAGSPPRALALDGLGALYDGDGRAARSLLARALTAKGGREEPVASFLAAELALSAGETTTAGDELRALVAAGHDGFDVQLRLALVAARGDDQAATEEHLRKAIAHAPTEVEPRLLLVGVLERQGAARQADRQREEEALLLVEPQSAALAKRVVYGAATAGRAGTVAELGPIATFIDPADADLQATVGRAFAATGRAREARQAFERALRLGPPDAAAVHRALAEQLERLGETTEAAAHRREAGLPDGGVSAPGAAPSRAPGRPSRAPAPAPLGLPPAR